MGKQFWKKWLTGLLCMTLFFSNILSTGTLVFATEADADISLVDKNLDEENTENNINGTEYDKVEDDVKEEEKEEKDSVKESTEENDEEQEDVKSQTELVGDVGVIASGSYGDIMWVIDANGKLTVEGTGDFSQTDRYDRAPWYKYRDSI